MYRIPTLVLILLVAVVVGCSGTAEKAEGATDSMKKMGEDTAKAVDDMADAGSEMLDDAADQIEQLPGEIKKMAQEYYDEIKDRESKLEEIKAAMNEMSPKDLMSEHGKQLKKESEKVTAELTKLKGRLQEMLDQGGEG